MKNELVFSGLQPTGTIHIGNYFGAIKQWIALQDTHDCLFCVVDLHALTVEQDPKTFMQQTLSTAIDFLALGIDPEHSRLFVQSQVPEHAELSWLFQTVIPVAELERMTQYKDKSKQNAKNVNAGLLTYPVLMAADILLYKGTLVPVGEDQVQHVELARVVARKFNARYGDVFPEPKPKLTEAKRIMSLTEPDKKMSKSGTDRSYIAITDEPAVIKQKLAKAVTATAGGGRNPGVENLLTIMREVCTAEVVKRFEGQERDGTVKYAELKDRLAQDLAKHLAPFRKRRTELLQKPADVQDILEAGRIHAAVIAKQTMTEVRKVVGLFSN